MNPRARLEAFVTGPENVAAYESALAFAQAPTHACGAWCVTGPRGSGKRHLLHAIGNYVRQREPKLTVELLTMSQLKKRLSSALADGRMAELHATARACDLLLLDHLPETPDDTLPADVLELITMPRRIAYTMADGASRLPIPGPEPVSLGAPGFSTRRAILASQAMRQDLAWIEDPELDALADVDTANLRALITTMAKMERYARFFQRNVHPYEIELLLQDAGRPEDQPRFTLELIKQVCAQHFSLTNLDKKVLIEQTSLGRMIAIALCYLLTTEPVRHIGQAFGYGDHGGAYYCLRKHHEQLHRDQQVRQALDAVVKRLVVA